MNHSSNIHTIRDTALILEGGGMRCVFTSGVLDFFMEQNIEFQIGRASCRERV